MGELSLDDSFNITLNVVFRYPYRVAVLLDTENSAFDYVQELLANSFERFREIVRNCLSVEVDNLIKPLSWITYATTRVYNMFQSTYGSSRDCGSTLDEHTTKTRGTQLSVVARVH